MDRQMKKYVLFFGAEIEEVDLADCGRLRFQQM